MAYDHRRVALVGCCVLAVVVGASLFPAAGFGGYPGTPPVDSDYYGSGEGVADTDDGRSADDDTADEDETAADDDGTTDEETGEDEPDGTETTEDEATDEDDAADEETDEPPADEESGDDSSTDESSSDSGSSLLYPVLLTLLFGLSFVSIFGIWSATAPERTAGVDASKVPSGFVPRLRFRLRRIPQLTMATTIGFARVSQRTVHVLSAATRDVAGAAGGIGRGALGGLGTLAFSLPSFALGGLGLFSGLGSLSIGLPSLFSRTRGRSKRRSKRRSTTRRETREPDAVTEPDVGPQTVEEAYEEMIEGLPIRRRHSRTPGEFERAAIDVGLPRTAVRSLTDAFCEIRYGGRPPTADRTRRAKEAFAAIEAARERGERR